MAHSLLRPRLPSRVRRLFPPQSGAWLRLHPILPGVGRPGSLTLAVDGLAVGGLAVGGLVGLVSSLLMSDPTKKCGPSRRGPWDRAKRALLVAAGTAAVALAMLGVLLPILPTVPFLLIAAYCYARSSERFYCWLTKNRIFGSHLARYLCGKGIDWRVKAGSVALLWAVILITVLLAGLPSWTCVLLLVIAVGVTVHLVRLAPRVCEGGESQSDSRQAPPARLRSTRRLSLGLSGLTYAAAFACAWAAVKVWGPLPPLAELAVGTLAATALVFVASLLFDNSSLYDPYWSLQPLAITVYYLWTGRAALASRDLLVACLVFLYAVRLTSNFYRDWRGLMQEDFRYVAFRRRYGKLYWPMSFLGIHLFPTLLVYLGCLPLYAVSRSREVSLSWLDGVATVVVLGAVAVAFVADEQLRRFRRRSREPGRHLERRYLDSGLWACSRHPNYLGEISTWWGLWLFALACGGAWWWTGVGALAITLLFVLVSVPMMEKRMLATRPGYEGYRRSTPMLVPGLRLRRRAREAG